MKKKREDRFFFSSRCACLLACERGCLFCSSFDSSPPPTFHLFHLWCCFCCFRHGLVVVPPLVRVKIKKKNKEEKRENASKYFPSGFVRFSAFCISLVSILYYLPRLGPTQSPPTSLPGLMTTTGGTELLLSPPSFSRPLSPPPPLLSPPPLEATTPGTKS